MSTTENNIDKASKRNSDKAPQAQTLKGSMALMKHKCLFMNRNTNL